METKYLKEWQNEMNICIRCAYCFEACPIYQQRGWESDGARGKVVLAYGLLTGEIEPSDYIAQKINECTFCKDCIERCSANVSIPDILTAARADLVEAGFKNDAHVALLDKIEKTGNIFGKEIKPPIQDGETPVLLGCRFLERSGDAQRYIEILKKIGIKPKIVDETCCGMPFAVLGYKDKLKKQKEEFRKRMPYKEFICMCTTCVFFINKSYPDLKPRYIINEIAERLPNYKTRKLGKKVTYHDPCNLGRGMGNFDEPRQILEQIGVEVVEMPTYGKQAECCGGGGGLMVTDISLTKELTEKRLKQAIDTGVDELATLCPTCEFNLSDAVKRNGENLKVKNVLDYVWEALV